MEYYEIEALIWFSVIILLVFFVVILYFSSRSKHRQFGEISCNRCGYIGIAKSHSIIFRGFQPVCSKCLSEDWTIHKNVTSQKESKDKNSSSIKENINNHKSAETFCPNCREIIYSSETFCINCGEDRA